MFNLKMARRLPSCLLAGMIWCLTGIAHGAEMTQAEAVRRMGIEFPLWTVIPFALLLFAIAVFPLVVGHWWEHNRNKGLVVALLAIPVAVYLLTQWGHAGSHELQHKLFEYLSFMALLTSLFVISGGVYVQGSLAGTPLVNSSVMAFGAVLANLVGTTGASVLLIRPLLRANRSRQQTAHIVIFFIFIVSNCAGLLTPLGDPPLYLGYLKGVPFEWTLRLWPQWLLINGLLLVIFHVWDQIVLAREELARPGSQLEEVMRHEPLRVKGIASLLLLGAVVATILAAGRGLGNGGEPWPFGWQEGILIGLAITGFAVTSPELRRNNSFTFGPIIEVGVLFLGIFITMAPALLILNAWGRADRQVMGMTLGVTLPWHYYWAVGVLSSFLDNAPTYLAFAAAACGAYGVPVDNRYLAELLNQSQSEIPRVLSAISCGAVMMGANTYIGNGPNFMVKAIAEENGVKMPGFFGYMFYSGLILLPLFVLVTLIFYR